MEYAEENHQATANTYYQAYIYVITRLDTVYPVRGQDVCSFSAVNCVAINTQRKRVLVKGTQLQVRVSSHPQALGQNRHRIHLGRGRCNIPRFAKQHEQQVTIPTEQLSSGRILRASPRLCINPSKSLSDPRSAFLASFVGFGTSASKGLEVWKSSDTRGIRERDGQHNPLYLIPYTDQPVFAFHLNPKLYSASCKAKDESYLGKRSLKSYDPVAYSREAQPQGKLHTS